MQPRTLYERVSPNWRLPITVNKSATFLHLHYAFCVGV